MGLLVRIDQAPQFYPLSNLTAPDVFIGIQGKDYLFPLILPFFHDLTKVFVKGLEGASVAIWVNLLEAFLLL